MRTFPASIAPHLTLAAAALSLAACSRHAPTAPQAADAPSTAVAPMAAGAPAAPAATSSPAVSSDRFTHILVPPGAYLQTFDAAKHTLRELGFLLERVDAEAGVMTTKPLGSAGIATPWSEVESGFDQQLEYAAQRQQRVVRIDFVPAGGPGASMTTDDLRAFTGPIEARILVPVYRVYSSGLRLNPGSIGRSTYPIDADLEKRSMLGYSVAIKEDRRLEDRLAASIARAASTGTVQLRAEPAPGTPAAAVDEPAPMNEAAPVPATGTPPAPKPEDKKDSGWRIGTPVGPNPTPPPR